MTFVQKMVDDKNIDYSLIVGTTCLHIIKLELLSAEYKFAMLYICKTEASDNTLENNILYMILCIGIVV